MNCWNPTAVTGTAMGISSQALEETLRKVQRLPETELLVEGSMSPSKLYENLSRHEIRSALTGMVLGDANLQMRVTNARLQLAHGPTHLDYVELKGEILRQIPGVKYSHTLVQHQNRKLGKVYPTWRVWTNNHPIFTQIRERIYAPKKRVTAGVLSTISPIGLALWYMDDGHLAIHHNAVRSEADVVRATQERSISSRYIHLCTYAFTLGENELIRDWLKSEWSVESRVKSSKGFFLTMNTENARKFVDVVRPYVLAVPSMRYKVDFKYKNDSVELLRFNVAHWITEEGHERAAPQVALG